VSGTNAGKPEKINVSRKMMATNDHAISWDGKQVAITGITPQMPAKTRTPADIHNPLFIMNMDGSPYTVYADGNTYQLAAGSSQFPNWNPGVSPKPAHRSTNE